MIEIRPIRPTETERFRALRLRALHEDPGAFDSTESVEGGLRQDFWKKWIKEGPERRVVVAERDGELVGTATASPYQGKPELLSLFAVWVAPDVRRTGVGRRLVTALLEWGATTPRKTVRVHVAEGDSAALAFFEALGFQDTGERLPFREDLGDARILERPVGA